jgi:hypothetical protein
VPAKPSRVPLQSGSPFGLLAPLATNLVMRRGRGFARAESIDSILAHVE